MRKKKTPPPPKLRFGQTDVFPWHQVDHALLAIRTTRAQLMKLRGYGIIAKDWHEDTLEMLARGEQALGKLKSGETDPGR